MVTGVGASSEAQTAQSLGTGRTVHPRAGSL